jgi:PKD repeat protein
MQNPKQLQDPDTYTGQYWDFAGEPHNNAGPCIKWFYLLVNGGSATNDLGTTYTVTGLGNTSAEQIAYRALTVYFVPNTNYAAARVAAIQAAKDLFGNCSMEVEQTARAWNAVGVGGPYSNNVIAPDFQSVVTNFCALPVTVNFNNITSNGQNYTWSFGDGTTANTTNAVHTYTTSGNYNVKLKATGCNNAVDSITKPSYIVISVPPSPVVVNGTGCGNGPVNLTASGTGVMSWYTNPFAATPLSTGNTFVTPNLTSNTTFYVANAVANSPSNGGMLNNTTGNGGYLASNAQWLEFNVLQNSTLNSIVAYANTAGNRTIELRNAGGLIYSTTTALTVGANTVVLNYALTPGNNYELGLSNTSTASLYRNTSGMSFPYNIGGCVSITGSSSGYYYYFYNWKVTKADCMSPAVPVVATIVPPPVASLFAPTNVFCAGDAPVNLVGSPAGGTLTGLNVTGNTFNPLTTGNSNVIYNYTDPNGCSDTSMINMQVLICTGIQSQQAGSGISIFPNPATDHLVVRNETGNCTISMVDASGKVVLNKTITMGEETIDLNGLARGLYLLNVSDAPGNLIKSVKLVKE